MLTDRLKGLRSVRMLENGSLRLTFSLTDQLGNSGAATRTEVVMPQTPVFKYIMGIIGRLEPGQIFLLQPLNGYQKLPPDPPAPHAMHDGLDFNQSSQ